MPTTNSIRKLYNLKRDISKFLHRGMRPISDHSKHVIQYYWEVSQKAEALIYAALGEEGMHFPIDVEALAEALGIPLVEEELNVYVNAKCINRKIGQIVIDRDFFSNKKTGIIYLDEMAALSSKRYAIAHEIVHYLMNYQESGYYEDYCIMPMCPKDVEEILADIFAIFLLIPVSLFFREFQDYVIWRSKEERTPVTTEDWIKYLAERSLLSEYYVAYGYQQLRYVAYWIYQAWYDDEKNEDMQMDEVERKNIQKATMAYFNDEVVALLFQ